MLLIEHHEEFNLLRLAIAQGAKGVVRALLSRLPFEH
jgi:hypothetical protein